MARKEWRFGQKSVTGHIEGNPALSTAAAPKANHTMALQVMMAGSA
jgi:hypothetical protein